MAKEPVQDSKKEAIESSRTLMDMKSMGGPIALKGFEFQEAYTLVRGIELLNDPGFTAIKYEGVEDVELRFEKDSVVTLHAIQVKNYRITLSKAREIVADFQKMEADSPGTWSWFAVVCGEMGEVLGQLAAGLQTYRSNTGFYAPEAAILVDSRARLAQQLEEAGLPADFVIERVSFDSENGRVYQQPDWVLGKALLDLQRFIRGMDPDTAQLIVAGFGALIRKRKGQPITRQDILEIIRASGARLALPDDIPLDLPRLYFEPETIPVPAGDFILGSEIQPEEEPEHLLTLPAYRIGRFPVTNREYSFYLAENPDASIPRPEKYWYLRKPAQERERHPVTGVSWHEANAYCRWLSRRTGRNYRLPTEAEWEKAARGATGLKFPWGTDWIPDACNLDQVNATPVDRYPQAASPCGCMDMLGNAEEWTSTRWSWSDTAGSEFNYPYNRDDGREDQAADGYRVYRSGIPGPTPDEMRSSKRAYDTPVNRVSWRGFRIVMES